MVQCLTRNQEKENPRLHSRTLAHPRKTSFSPKAHADQMFVSCDLVCVKLKGEFLLCCWIYEHLNLSTGKKK